MASHPDLSSSVFQDISRQYGNDKEAAEAAWQKLINEEETERRRTLSDAREICPALPERVITDILQANGWNLDVAIPALIDAVERMDYEERRRREEERRQRYLRAQDLAMRTLQCYLTSQNKEELQQLLEDNEGDVDQTVELFVQNTLALRKVEEHDRELQRRQTLINALLDTQLEGIVRADIEVELERCNWDHNQASGNLLRLCEQRKIVSLQRFCTMANASFPVERLERTLNEHGWNVLRAREALLREVEEEEPVPTPAPDFLTRSIFLAEEVKKNIELELGNTDAQETVKERLNHVLRNQPAIIGLQRVPGSAPAPQSARLDPPPVSAEEENSVKVSQAGESPSVESQVFSESPLSQKAGITLHLSATRLDKSEALQVNWQVPEGSTYTVTNRDWIGLYTPRDQSERSYVTYQWVVPGTNSVSFPLSKLSYGDYTCRYFSAAQKTCVGVSPTFTVGPVFTLTPILTVNADTLQAVLKIEQKFGDIPTSKAWVGLYFIESGVEVPNQNYLSYQRLSSLKDNTLIFDLPKTGEWEFRLFPENTYVAAAISRLTVAGEDSLVLTLEAPQIKVVVDLQTRDIALDAPWIGVYKVEEQNIRMYRRYKYLTTTGKSTIQFKAPIHTGVYEARLYSGTSDTVLARSNSLEIRGI